MGPSRKKWLLLGVVLAGIFVGGVGFVAGRMVQSPADAIASAAPPEPTVLTAVTRVGSIEPGTDTEGTVDWPKRFSVGEAEGQSTVVTRVYARPGQRISAGQVLIELNDRPVFALDGAVPMLRDLSIGTTGPDVERLQEGLEKLGLSISDKSGVFGVSTERAFAALYRRNGYPGPMPSSSSAPASDEGSETSAAAGYVVLKADVVFLPEFPARVVSLEPGLGDNLGKGIEIAPDRPLVRASIPAGMAAKLATGQKVQLQFPKPQSATVSSIGVPTADEGGAVTVSVTFTPDKPITQARIGDKVPISLHSKGAAQNGLLVPLAALFRAAEVGTHVRVRSTDGERIVEVEVVASDSQVAMVKTRGEGRLKAGDAVVVGITR